MTNKGIKPWPHGSVPYDCGPSHGTARLTVIRLACSILNHYPRFSTGSWCWGYRYVCGRCYMYADPIPQKTLDDRADHLNNMTDQMGSRTDGCADVGRWPPHPYWGATHTGGEVDVFS